MKKLIMCFVLLTSMATARAGIEQAAIGVMASQVGKTSFVYVINTGLGILGATQLGPYPTIIIFGAKEILYPIWKKQHAYCLANDIHRSRELRAIWKKKRRM